MSKQIVLRKDIVSGEMVKVNELIRVVKTPMGEIKVDPEKKMNGRGIYLKPTLESLAVVEKKRLLDRGLKTKVPQGIYLQIKEEIENNWD